MSTMFGDGATDWSANVTRDLRSYIWRAREAIATTSFVEVRDSEKGFDGRLMVAGVESEFVLWT